MLLAGTATAKIHIYDVPSHQLLRTISLGSAALPANAPNFHVTCLHPMLRPADLVGHVALGSGVFGKAESETVVRPVAVFQRVRDRKARERHEVGVILSGASLV